MIAVLGIVYAHHSIAGAYDGRQPTTIEGVVVQFQFINPHPWLTVEIKDANGAAQIWKLEMDNRRELERIGLASDTFKPGDLIKVTGDLARQVPNSLYIRRLERPSDGFMLLCPGASCNRAVLRR
jgi:hypothetical protein